MVGNIIKTHFESKKIVAAICGGKLLELISLRNISNMVFKV